MAGTVIVTSSAADLTPALAASAGIVVVPSTVTFGADEFRAGVDLSLYEFWDRMLAPGAPAPITAPPSPGAFANAYRDAFEAGADAIVSVQMGSRMSATYDSARVAAQTLPDHEILVVDTRSASMATGLLALLASDMAKLGVAAAEIARVVTARLDDVHLYAALETLEHLRRGGRLTGGAPSELTESSNARPIIAITDGQVTVVDQGSSRRDAQERVIALLTRRPAERLAILYSPPADAVSFRDATLARMPGQIGSQVIVYPVGMTIGPHVGPGCLGGVVLTAG